MKSRMAAPGKFKIENRRYSNPGLSDTEILFPCSPTKFEIRLYLQQFKVNFFKSGGFF